MGTNSNPNSFLLFLAEKMGTKLGRMGCLGQALSCWLCAILFSESRNLYHLILCQFAKIHTKKRANIYMSKKKEISWPLDLFCFHGGFLFCQERPKVYLSKIKGIEDLIYIGATSLTYLHFSSGFLVAALQLLGGSACCDSSLKNASAIKS